MEFELFIVEGVMLEEDETGKKRRVGEPVYEGHRTLSYANTAANRLHFDEGYTMTNVYKTTKMKFVGKENGFYA
jgi:hypothetical protein